VYLSVLPHLLRPLGRLILHREFQRARRILLVANATTAVSKQYLEWAQRLRITPGKCDRVFHLGYRMPASAQLAIARTRSVEFLKKFNLPQDRLKVTFLGQFAASYDIDTIVRAAGILHTSDSNLHFVLAGAGDKFERIGKSARNISSLTLTGWLEHLDTLTLLQQSQIGLAAYSATAPQSLPYKPFEYMAFGLPIITSLGGELRDIVEGQGIGRYYKAGDARSLAFEIQQMAAIPQRRLEAGRRARELYVKLYDTDQITRDLIAHLEKIAAVPC